MIIDKLRTWLGKLPGQPFGKGPPFVAVLRLSGVIAAGSGPMRSGVLSLGALAGAIHRAFKIPGASAVALIINSPGGSPVQSALIADRIRQHAEEEKRPVFAFVEDVAASGGYWLALAADEIYAEANSIVGSIGVISAGFGFDELLQKIGVERRVHAQGAHKSLLDPFRPEQPDDVARLEKLQKQIHESFITTVRARRAGKLKAETTDLFQGDIFLGPQAVDCGLIDGIGNIRQVMRQRFGEKVLLRVIETAGGGWLRRRLGLHAPGPLVEELLSVIEHRALWSRFGL